MSYCHFNAKERHTLMYLLHLQLSYREIGRRLGRHHSTISREVRRNGRLFGWSYWDGHAERQARSRQQQPRHRKRRDYRPLYQQVITRLQQSWSPDSMSGWLQRHGQQHRRMQVSPETIYQWVYHDANAGGTLHRLLHSQHKQRRPQRRYGAKRFLIPNRVGIAERSVAIATRSRIGHWEGDSVEGAKGTGGIATHVERRSRFLVAAMLKDKQATTFSQSTQRAFADIPQRLCKTLTLDNGTENTLHHEITADKGMKVFFAEPYSPWQRGTNEQTNGLLRRYFPKGTDFRKVSHRELQQTVTLINQRPRKILNYRTPEEVFYKAWGGAL